jgi:hypothetical protein
VLSVAILLPLASAPLGYLYDVSLIWLVAVSVSLQVLAVPAVWVVTSRHQRAA